MRARPHVLVAGALLACGVLALVQLAPPAARLAALLGPTATAPRNHARPAPSAPAPLARARTPSQPAPPSLQEHLAGLATRFKEPVGIAVSEVGKDWVAAVNGEDLFPQQSVSKTWVALTLMDQVDHGRIRLTDPVLMRPEDRSVFYEPIVGRIGRHGYQTTVGS